MRQKDRKSQIRYRAMGNYMENRRTTVPRDTGLGHRTMDMEEPKNSVEFCVLGAKYVNTLRRGCLYQEK